MPSSSPPTTPSKRRSRRRAELPLRPPFAPVARATRNGSTESWHYGAAAVVTPAGALVARIGDPGVETFLRSAAKPFQALPLLEADGAEKFDLDDPELAVICASHAGTPEHTERVEALLARGGFTDDDLRCGPHPPLDEGAARRLAAAGEPPGRVHNNCSGKHAGMLLACRLLDLPSDSYPDADHPLQQAILERLALCSGLPAAAIGTGVDGCGVVTYRMPLRAAARAFAALAEPPAAGLPGELAGRAGRVAAAMTRAPEMVAGRGRFTTRLMQVTGGRVLGKEGYEGFYGAAVRGPVAMGVVVKIADGSGRCRDGVVLDVLRQLGSLSAAELAELAEFHRPQIHNTLGAVVGEVVSEPELEEA